MWEMNAVAINGSWEESDEGPDAVINNTMGDFSSTML